MKMGQGLPGFTPCHSVPAEMGQFQESQWETRHSEEEELWGGPLHRPGQHTHQEHLVGCTTNEQGQKAKALSAGVF